MIANDGCIKVHFIGGEGINWALDEDLRLAKLCAPDNVKLEEMSRAQVVYSIWPGALLALDPKVLAGKIVVCEFDNPPNHWIKQPQFHQLIDCVSLWITHTTQATEQAKKINLEVVEVPYRLEDDTFFPIESENEIIGMRNRYGIPPEAYVVGNFHRDTEGYDLGQMKPQKGADVFVSIIKELQREKKNIHVLLAGPRRHWIRSRFDELDISYTFIGQAIDGDDIPQNILPRKQLNMLYACLDLLLVTSRWEGGPYSILEGAATRTKILSSRVGMAEDVLDKRSIFDHADQALEVILSDIKNNFLHSTIENQYERYASSHTIRAAEASMYDVFQIVKNLVPSDVRVRSKTNIMRRPESKIRRVMRKIGFRKASYSKKSISIFREFHKPPYGGGNQFMLALKDEFEKLDVAVLNNKVGDHIDAYLFDSMWFDQKLLDKLAGLSNPRVGHRIDGPIYLYRGKDKSIDDHIFNVNEKFASFSIIQSVYTLRSVLSSGYKPISPVVIPNAVNPQIFCKPEGYTQPSGKIKLISTSWSDNPMKGLEDYKWIDENLDFTLYSYTFYGRIKSSFSNIQIRPPVSSVELARELRSHDVYVTASRNDPCSNALIEAMSCGLPALYKNSGGHPELVGFGGLPYDNVAEVPEKLARISANLPLFSNCLALLPMSEIARRYLRSFFPGEDN